MALRRSQGLEVRIGDRTPSDPTEASPIPILHQADLEEHRREPHVKARLRRVRALMALQGQQKS